MGGMEENIMKISRETMQAKLKGLSIEKLEEIASVNFATFMRKPNESVCFEKFRDGSRYVTSVPSNFSNLVMFWIADSLVQNIEREEFEDEIMMFPKETKTTRTLYDFVELYADINLASDEEITLDFPKQSDEEEYGEMIATIISAFKVRYADKIKAYESFKASKKGEIDFLFRNMAEKAKKDDEAE